MKWKSMNNFRDSFQNNITQEERKKKAEGE
jgi:hypothetical protein